MLFNSFQFPIFFLVTTLIYFRLPLVGRWYLLLAASCYFYMAFIPVYILILAFTIVVDYLAGILIQRSEGRRRRFFLALSIVGNVGVLAIFKYLPFINRNLAALYAAFHWQWPVHDLSIVLPIGLSFHTFQAMAYTIEVYRGHQKAETNFVLYALYVMFYPQLVAGPIERPQNLLTQLRELHRFDYERVTDGLKLMLRGFFKKVVVADRLAILVDAVYAAPRQHHGTALFLATVFFAFQIYADFSGYSDIAIGAAQVLGIRLMTNFRQPYFSQSVAEFWSRWHISLSTWFRDYLYIPLGGNRVGRMRWYANLMVTFLISGLWHGAAWTYVIWGGLNGVYLILGVIARQARGASSSQRRGEDASAVTVLVNRLATFLVICAAWVFFRARTAGDAIYILRHSVDLTGLLRPSLLLGPAGLTSSRGQLLGAFVVIGALLVLDAQSEKQNVLASLRRRPVWFRWAIYYGFAFAILFMGQFGTQQFIYFQF
ncbi:MAG TPA: MBOAT family O-acyltransferase [Polyangia bacterium]|nr:MBOAT family O-acyltransferase [Polyangia bacterium]